MSTANKLSDSESTMDSCPKPRSLATCVSSYSPVQLERTEALRTWLQEGFRVSPFPQQESNLEPTIPGTCGPQLSQPSMLFDQSSASLRTLQLCLIQDTSEPSSETWPRAGIVRAGKFFPQPKWEHRISEIGSELWRTPTNEDSQDREFARNNRGEPKLSAQVKYGKDARWPTPNASAVTGGPGNSGRQGGLNLRTAVKQFSTPTAQMAKHAEPTEWERDNRQNDLHVTVGGQPNPDWVEWLIGWPVGWTSLDPLSPDAVTQWLDETQSGEWWQHEHDLPRTAKGIANRTHRLKALGNGQVAACVATVWRILAEDLV